MNRQLPRAISVPDEWEIAAIRGELGSTSAYCPVPMRYIDRRDGRSFRIREDCDLWTCQRCAPKRAQRLLEHFAERVHEAEPLWLTAWGGDDDAVIERLRQRRARARRSTGRSIEQLSIRRRNPPFHFLFATAVLSGRQVPVDGWWLYAEKALKWAAIALWVPGVRGVRGLGAWREPNNRPRGSGRSAYVGIANDERWALVEDLVAQEIRDCFGIEVWDGARPEPVPEDWWIECHRRQHQIARESATTRAVPTVASDVTVRPYRDVTLPPYEENPWENRDFSRSDANGESVTCSAADEELDSARSMFEGLATDHDAATEETQDRDG